MALKRPQRSVLKLALAVVAATIGLLYALAPSIRGNPLVPAATILIVELAVFTTAFWVAGRA